MKKTSKYNIYALFLGLLICTLVYISYKGYKTTNPTIEIHYEENQSSEIEKISLFGEQKQYVAIDFKNPEQGTSNISVSQNYVARVIYKQRDDEQSNEYQIDTGESVKVTLYGLNSEGAKVKELDLLAIIQKANLDGMITDVNAITYSGKDYLYIKLKTGDVDSSTHLFEIDSEQFTVNITLEKNSFYMTSVFSNAFELTNVNTLVRKYNLFVNSFELTVIDGKAVNLGKVNLPLVQPEIAKTLENGGKIYVRPLTEDFGSWFNTVGYWFATEGQNFIDAYAEDTSTGERTQIESYLDYENWIANHSEEINKVDPKDVFY
ncbi:hypothetical protein [Streptococcus loxodontisalivarius]|uniref:Uncharacterized protein n=1 Tax=Streptococcus loxodontisalivarius TaxID=1349415 RepID=A0ABS2PS31_9STRE|nr:hypothetical protein [Streptococcus loxodontisalivarius]MBM7642800.1 hypothetical protein [Streptococcus loxodontisalivarius]